MEVSNLTAKLIILLIPGITSYFVYKRITIRETKRSDLMFVTVSILLGFLSYSSVQTSKTLGALVINYIAEKQIFEPHPQSNLFFISRDVPIDYQEVICAIVMGIIIAGVFGKIDSDNTIIKFCIIFIIYLSYKSILIS